MGTDRRCFVRQAPNAAARQQVQSRKPQLPPPRGRIQLDDEPDVREVGLRGNICNQQAERLALAAECCCLSDTLHILSTAQVLLMSDELKLDEMECLLCLLAGHQEVNKSATCCGCSVLRPDCRYVMLSVLYRASATGRCV